MSESQVAVSEHKDETVTEEGEVSGRTRSPYQCSSCEMDLSVDEAYRCQTCADQDLDPSHPINFFCDACVTGGHIRKQHDIRDVQGRQVGVCPEHKSLCFFYCESCEKMACNRCLKSHESHKFVPIEVEVKRVKSEVFEMLDILEKKEKLTRLKSEKLSGVSNEIQKEGCEIISAIEHEIEIMKNRVTQRINAKMQEVENVAQRANENLLSFVSLQGSLRDVLGHSNSGALQAFLDVKVSYREALSVFEQLDDNGEKPNLLMRESVIVGVSDLLHNLNLTDLIINMGTKSENTFFDLNGNEVCELIRYDKLICMVKHGVNIKDLSIKPVARFHRAFLPEFDFNKFVRYYPFCKEELLIELDNNKWLRFKLDSFSFENMPAPQCEGKFICPVKLRGNIEWIYVKENGEVCCTHYGLIHQEDDVRWLMPVDGPHIPSIVLCKVSNSDLLLIEMKDCDGKSEFEVTRIPLSVHGVHHLILSHVSIPDQNILFLWSGLHACVVVLKRTGKEWSKTKEVSWKDTTRSIEVDVDFATYRLIPFIYDYSDGKKYEKTHLPRLSSVILLMNND